MKWISSSGLRRPRRRRRRRRLQAEPETKTGGVFQLINVQTNSFTYIAPAPDPRSPLSTRLYLPQINIPWPNILFILFRHFFFCISLCLLENLKRLRNELRNGLTHNSECTHTHIGTVLAKFFIPIYRCIISLLFPSFLLSKWFLLTFCARYTASYQPDQGEPHSSHACPFPCTPLPLPLPLPRLSFHLLCHCAETAS